MKLTLTELAPSNQFALTILLFEIIQQSLPLQVCDTPFAESLCSNSVNDTYTSYKCKLKLVNISYFIIISKDKGEDSTSNTTLPPSDNISNSNNDNQQVTDYLNLFIPKSLSSQFSLSPIASSQNHFSTLISSKIVNTFTLQPIISNQFLNQPPPNISPRPLLKTSSTRISSSLTSTPKTFVLTTMKPEIACSVQIQNILNMILNESCTSYDCTADLINIPSCYCHTVIDFSVAVSPNYKPSSTSLAILSSSNQIKLNTSRMDQIITNASITSTTHVFTSDFNQLTTTSLLLDSSSNASNMRIYHNQTKSLSNSSQKYSLDTSLKTQTLTLNVSLSENYVTSDPFNQTILYLLMILKINYKFTSDMVINKSSDYQLINNMTYIPIVNSCKEIMKDLFIKLEKNLKLSSGSVEIAGLIIYMQTTSNSFFFNSTEWNNILSKNLPGLFIKDSFNLTATTPGSFFNNSTPIVALNINNNTTVISIGIATGIIGSMLIILIIIIIQKRYLKNHTNQESAKVRGKEENMKGLSKKNNYPTPPGSHFSMPRSGRKNMVWVGRNGTLSVNRTAKINKHNNREDSLNIDKILNEQDGDVMSRNLSLHRDTSYAQSNQKDSNIQEEDVIRDQSSNIRNHDYISVNHRNLLSESFINNNLNNIKYKVPKFLENDFVKNDCDYQENNQNIKSASYEQKFGGMRPAIFRQVTKETVVSDFINDENMTRRNFQMPFTKNKINSQFSPKKSSITSSLDFENNQRYREIEVITDSKLHRYPNFSNSYAFKLPDETLNNKRRTIKNDFVDLEADIFNFSNSNFRTSLIEEHDKYFIENNKQIDNINFTQISMDTISEYPTLDLDVNNENIIFYNNNIQNKLHKNDNLENIQNCLYNVDKNTSHIGDDKLNNLNSNKNLELTNINYAVDQNNNYFYQQEDIIPNTNYLNNIKNNNYTNKNLNDLKKNDKNNLNIISPSINNNKNSFNVNSYNINQNINNNKLQTLSIPNNNNNNMNIILLSEDIPDIEIPTPESLRFYTNSKNESWTDKFKKSMNKVSKKHLGIASSQNKDKIHRNSGSQF